MVLEETLGTRLGLEEVGLFPSQEGKGQASHGKPKPGLKQSSRPVPTSLNPSSRPPGWAVLKGKAGA